MPRHTVGTHMAYPRRRLPNSVSPIHIRHARSPPARPVPSSRFVSTDRPAAVSFGRTVTAPRDTPSFRRCHRHPPAPLPRLPRPSGSQCRYPCYTYCTRPRTKKETRSHGAVFLNKGGKKKKEKREKREKTSMPTRRGDGVRLPDYRAASARTIRSSSATRCCSATLSCRICSFSSCIT